MLCITALQAWRRSFQVLRQAEHHAVGRIRAYVLFASSLVGVKPVYLGIFRASNSSLRVRLLVLAKVSLLWSGPCFDIFVHCEQPTNTYVQRPVSGIVCLKAEHVSSSQYPFGCTQTYAY
eukprot:6183586-Pleurochrysis_carterae.AAC.1